MAKKVIAEVKVILEFTSFEFAELTDEEFEAGNTPENLTQAILRYSVGLTDVLEDSIDHLEISRLEVVPTITEV